MQALATTSDPVHRLWTSPVWSSWGVASSDFPSSPNTGLIAEVTRFLNHPVIALDTWHAISKKPQRGWLGWRAEASRTPGAGAKGNVAGDRWGAGTSSAWRAEAAAAAGAR